MSDASAVWAAEQCADLLADWLELCQREVREVLDAVAAIGERRRERSIALDRRAAGSSVRVGRRGARIGERGRERAASAERELLQAQQQALSYRRLQIAHRCQPLREHRED